MARALSEASVCNSDAGSQRDARRHFWALTLGSIGVVYGDIGTSPLYAMRESVLAARGVSEAASAEIILGILSLIIWALILVVTVSALTPGQECHHGRTGCSSCLLEPTDRVVEIGTQVSV